MLKECIDNLREKAPLIHNITNYVTVNDVAILYLPVVQVRLWQMRSKRWKRLPRFAMD